jgi:hypothetical protein
MSYEARLVCGPAALLDHGWFKLVRGGGMTLAITCDDGRTGTMTFDGPDPAHGKGTIGKDEVLMTLAAWRRG